MECEACYKAEADTEIKDGDYTIHVCRDCKEKYEQQQVYNKIQPLVEALCKELNGGDKARVAQALCDAFNHEHRYLQSEAFSALWKFFGLYGTQDEARFFDGRNQHCRTMTKKWYDAV
jgi:hypothetical protein